MQSASQSYTFSAHPDRRLRASPDAIATVGATGATAILDPASGQFYTLNDVGGRVWSLLCEGTTFGTIVEQLEREYDAPIEVLSTDTDILLGQLAAAELLRVE